MFLKKFQAEEAVSNVEGRSSPGYQFRQRYLQDIMSAIEAKETEGESKQVRVRSCCSAIFNTFITSCSRIVDVQFIFNAVIFLVQSQPIDTERNMDFDNTTFA